MANNTKQVSDNDFAKTLATLAGGEIDTNLVRALNKG